MALKSIGLALPRSKQALEGLAAARNQQWKKRERLERCVEGSGLAARAVAHSQQKSSEILVLSFRCHHRRSRSPNQ